MTSREKAATTRILIDLIKADKVIARQEIDLYKTLKGALRISRNDEVKAFAMTLSEAIEVLKKAETSTVNDLLGTFRAMTASDGSCPRQEVLLMLALNHCLTQTDDAADVISVEVGDNWFDERQVLYIESYFDTEINQAIADAYRHISSELRLCGLDFVYLPRIIDHYIDTDPQLLLEIVLMLYPNLSERQATDLICQIKNYDTARFCTEELCHKLGFSGLDETDPALLLRINQSRVEDAITTNFLRIPVEPDTLVDTIYRFVDMFLNYHSEDRIVVSNKRDEKGSFLYKGFYRRLLETLLLRKARRCNLVIDTIRGEISFPEADVKLDSLHRKEKAAYILFLFYSRLGGISFDVPKSTLDRLQKQFALIYNALGGNAGRVPDITNPRTRTPIISRIKSCIEQRQHLILDHTQFIVQRDPNYGAYNLTAPEEVIRFRTSASDDTTVPFSESELFKVLSSVR